MKELKPPYYKLITIDGYRYVVDYDIKVGDRIHGTILKGNNVYVSDKKDGYNRKDGVHHISLEEAQIMGAYKIIASNNPALPDLLWLPEPDGQEDIEAIKKLAYAKVGYSHTMTGTYEEGFIDGYKVAKGKGTYSEDDMLAYGEFRSRIPKDHKQFVRDVVAKSGNYPTERDYFNLFKSFKPEPIGVELEMEEGYCKNGVECSCSMDSHKTCYQIPTPKVINNSVIVKRWIYAD